jgi:sugar (pentulose or hexulose) kinase
MRARGAAFLGIDLGTTNIKAQIVKEDGRIISSGSAPVGITYGSDGAAEQDFRQIWDGTIAAVRQAVTDSGGAAVSAVGVSSQGGALQVLDSSGGCAGPVIGWQDSRGDPWDRDLTARLGSGWFVRHIGFSKSSSAPGQLLRLRSQGALPHGFRVGWVGDLVVGRLCGRRAHDGTSLSEACLFNPSLGTEDGELLGILGIGKDLLPDLLGVHESAGGLLPDVARSLGLPEGIPVGPAVHDQYAAATGCGVVRSGDTMLGAGTAWVLLALGSTLDPPVAGVALVGRHPVQGIFGQMLSMVNGGACVSWAARTLSLGGLGVEETDALMAAVPAGSGGLRFLPLLSEIGGAGLPPGTAGRLDGLRLGHTQGHVMRSLVEGLACELGRYLEMMREGGVSVRRLALCGKAAASSVTPGIIADTTGLPVDCVAIAETSSLGAAVFARALVEQGSALVELADVMKPPALRIEPGVGRAEARSRLEAYLAACGALSERRVK